MRIRRLRLAGFGPYRGEQVVDFDRFDEEGLFLITGKTGAGKSSILDAICFALYNTIPRFEGRESKPRSHHCSPDDPSFVELDFDVHGETYRVWRTPEYQRPAKRGGGLTTAKSEARLFRLDGDEWVGVAARAVDVGTELTEILPIKADQFLQVILLAQNRFQRFLLAKTDERRALLRALFGTERFERLESALHERRRALDAQVADARSRLQHLATVVAQQAGVEERVEPDLAWFTSTRQGLADELFQADVAARAATSRSEAAELELARVTALAERQERRDRARGKLEDLLSRQADVDDAAARVTAARRAAVVWPLLTGCRTADADAVASAERAARLTAAWRATETTDVADLDSFVEEQSARLGVLRAALADEERLPALEREVTAAAAAIEQHDGAAVSIRTALDEVPQRFAELDEESTPLAELAATLADRKRDVRQLDEVLAEARRAEKLQGELDLARRALLDASATNAAAAAAYDALLRRRIDHMAFELAEQLTPGEPCVVCGGTEHPAPAATDSPLVAPEDLDAADAAASGARAALDRAQDSLRGLEAEVAAATARTEGRTVGALTDECAAAADRCAAARAAAERLAELQTQRAQLETELADLRERSERLAAERAELVQQQSDAVAAHTAVAARVAEMRGDAVSVARCVGDAETSLAAARDLVEARRVAEERAAAATTARASLDEALEEQGFAGADALVAAHLTATEVDRLSRTVDAHREELAAVRAQLDEAQLAELPDDPVDPAPARDAAAVARAERDEVLAARAALNTRLEFVGGKVIEVEDLLARSERMLEEHARVSALAAVVRGDEPNTRRMRLETFVLAGRLESIIAAANRRLHTMTSERYELKLDDEKQFRNAETGLGIGVLDSHTGLVRQPASLSGGEMFLASLSLALGLAEVVSEQAGGIRLDTLFVDEGFGSLDGETLEVAMHALDALRAGGRTVGVISHVESMKERIPAKLHIRVAPSGESEILTKETVGG
ncbi:AAA family ATPase [Herbiconiux sp. SYSU D00978]|uniref:AAA family ATPase n=1 Tax=Herbiconiux sp. SYSU D00978 TaxID=2812562 RepID=UPI001A97C50A|nr:SMC family ATPase [Herbiconiux sp. SYSU D00978]